MGDVQTFESVIHAPGLELPVRSTLVVHGDRRILISPIRFDADQIKSMGQVTDIVAPCLFHHLFVPHAIRHFPGAVVWGVPGFKKKRPDIAWSKVLTPEIWPYSDVLEVLPLQGVPKQGETVLFHKPTRTLIATDFCFNLKKPKGWLAPLALRITGNYNGFALSRLTKLLMRDRSAFEHSLGILMNWDIEQIIMAHGEVVASGGKALLQKALQERGYVPQPTS